MRAALLSSLPKLVQSWVMDRRYQHIGDLVIETSLDELGRSEGLEKRTGNRLT